MKLFVGVTDFDWYASLSQRPQLDEVNFWSPGGVAFRVLAPGELFLFKLKAAHGHAIVGGGVFARDTRLPLSLAWDAFGLANGADSLSEMVTRIRRYQSPEARGQRDPVIGCRLIQQPFLLPREDWFRVPETFPVTAVSGKSYETASVEGAYLLRELELRRAWELPAPAAGDPTPGFGESRRFGTPHLVTPRLGQGTFRVAVLDEYDRRCAVTGERTLPLLDAAHIRPWEAGGEHRAGNGIPLRTDVHRLFDLGYVTISNDHRFEVSPRLKEDYENGRDYYTLHGRALRQPKNKAFLPSAEALEWHHQNRWARPGDLAT